MIRNVLMFTELNKLLYNGLSRHSFFKLTRDYTKQISLSEEKRKEITLDYDDTHYFNKVYDDYVKRTKNPKRRNQRNKLIPIDKFKLKLEKQLVRFKSSNTDCAFYNHQTRTHQQNLGITLIPDTYKYQFSKRYYEEVLSDEFMLVIRKITHSEDLRTYEFQIRLRLYPGPNANKQVLRYFYQYTHSVYYYYRNSPHNREGFRNSANAVIKLENLNADQICNAYNFFVLYFKT